jgi:23S rRNA (cytosine1962-C5)-methyltransferase
MSLIRLVDRPPVHLRLARDLSRSIRRGHPWVYAESLREIPKVPAGSKAVLLDYKHSKEIARGYCDPHSPIAFRSCTVDEKDKLDDRWARRQFDRAYRLRKALFRSPSSRDGTARDQIEGVAPVDDLAGRPNHTTGFRLFHGEGDGLPGLVVDIYGEVAVIKLDGPAATNFWDAEGIAEWLMQATRVKAVVQRERDRGKDPRIIAGELDDPAVPFLEYGLKFTADVLHGQKTGFFLDQRENRALIRKLAYNRRVLNLFSYTGGFSIAAGVGGAQHVTSVDVAEPAIEVSRTHWELNELSPGQHEAVSADVFDYLAEAKKAGHRWEVIIVDPPSFAPSQEALSRAIASYERLFGLAAELVSPAGLLAAASCSSHLRDQQFLEICEESLSAARRRGRMLTFNGPPADHPAPVALREFRYLKFALMQLD